jgi:uncharacterized protein with ParB-like and HNH nuclease domain/predicted transport protein
MKAGEEKFSEILKKETQFKVPIYQRKYEWTIGNCKVLMEDIERILENSTIPIHFIGSIVYIDPEGQARVGSTREIRLIDGQQRLTTFTLLFLALEKIAKENKDLDLAKKIRNNYLINEYSKLPIKNKLVLNKSDQAVLQKIFDGSEITSNDHPILINFNFVYNKIKEFLNRFSIDEILETLNKVMVVDVCLYLGQDNPQQIFESLNATGKALEDSDLIKNFVLMDLDEETQKIIYNSYWEKIEQSLGEDIVEFIRTYLYMEKNISTNIKDLYKEFKTYFYNTYNRERTEELVKNLLKYSKLYMKISSKVPTNDKTITQCLESLNALGFDSYYPFLLKVAEKFELEELSKESYLSIIKAIESFIIRRSICGVPTNSLNPIFRTIWLELDKKNIEISFIKILKLGERNQKWPNDVEFEEKLKFNDLYDKRLICKIVLKELEKWENKEANKDFNSLTIEHIIPQAKRDPNNLSENWKAMLGENYKEVWERWIDKLGNLTLTGYNTEYSDNDFEIKKTIKGGLLESGLRLNKFIAEFSIWDEESIRKRAGYLSKIAIQRWSYFNDIAPDKKQIAEKKLPTEEEHLESAGENIKKIYAILKNKLLLLGSDIELSPQKKYLAFKTRTNFVDVQIQKESIKIHINMKKGTLLDPLNKCKDMSKTGHYGNGDYQIFIKNESEIEYLMGLAKQSYETNS